MKRNLLRGIGGHPRGMDEECPIILTKINWNNGGERCAQRPLWLRGEVNEDQERE